MARREEKEKAIRMRLNGASYSQIREKIPVAKSTLSNWLKDFPLSEKRIRELRDNNPRRIERFRETMRKKRLAKKDIQHKKAQSDIGELSQREKFLIGLGLYWGEGGKSKDTTVGLSNTDPHMLLFFIEWLDQLGVKKEQLKIHLHLYSDMDIAKEEKWWADTLRFDKKQFRKSYIKKSKHSEITWKNPSQHGTCNVLYGNRELYDYILMAIRVLKEC